MVGAINSQEKVLGAASEVVTYVVLSKLNLVVLVVEISGLLVVVMVALETAVDAGLISAVVTSQVLPSELTHHVSLMTTN